MKGTKEIRSNDNIHELLKSFALRMREIHFPETDTEGNPHLGRFLIDNGRLPFITDDPKPWGYRGWLLPYRQMCEAHPLVPKRYDYVLRSLDAGKLLDEPIPQVRFLGEGEPATRQGMKMLEDMVGIVERRSHSWNNFREFAEWLGFALGVLKTKSPLAEDVQEQLYRKFSLEPFLLHPTDYFGQYLAEQGHGKRNGFFPTPMCVCEVMTRINFHDAGTSDLRLATTQDCCVGTGRMLLTASNYSLRLYGQDIDALCVLITKINLALYAPWYFIPDSFFPEKVPETMQKPSGAVKDVQMQEIEQETGNPTLFEMSQFEMKKVQRSKSAKKVFTTEIEQPSLF